MLKDLLVEEFHCSHDLIKEEASTYGPPPRMDTRIARRLMQKKKRLDAYRPLPPYTVERLHEDLRVLLTYHFNAIEGNTLSLAVTQMVLA